MEAVQHSKREDGPYCTISGNEPSSVTLYKVQVGKDQEKAQSEKDSHQKKPRWEKTKLTVRYLYHENNEQLFSQLVATQLPKLN